MALQVGAPLLPASVRAAIVVGWMERYAGTLETMVQRQNASMFVPSEKDLVPGMQFTQILNISEWWLQ